MLFKFPSLFNNKIKNTTILNTEGNLFDSCH